jgi:acyl carrier protein phosphodiesterase
LNYLAHQFLSGDNDELRVGNFIADFIKGKKYLKFDKSIIHGIKYHREIDWYTDNHAVVDDLKLTLRPYFAKYSGVAIDVYFDHFLAISWNKYSDQDLKDYTQGTYELMYSWNHLFPERLNHMLIYMKRDDWLYNYQFIAGIDRALKGISTRTKFDSGLEKGGEVLSKHYDQIKEVFELFFEDILKNRKSLIEGINLAD